MTDRDHDPEDLRRVSRRYRELGAEEPPRALDDAILAAARREAGARPGSPGRAAPQRWYAPLAAAAVLVLAVAVTLHMQSEQPDIAEPAAGAKQPAVPSAAAPSAAEAGAQWKSRVEPQLKSAARERVGVVNEVVNEAVKPTSPKTAASSRPSEPVPFPADRAAAVPHVPAAPQVAAPAPAPAPSAVLSSRDGEARGSASGGAGAIARQAEERTSRDAEAAARAPQAGPVQALAKRAAAQAGVQAETPERELERIAELRRQGRHDEADKALAEFRKRYPEFRIPDEMRERVERR